MSFYVGQKVVCVKTHSQGDPKAGNTYTVRAIALCSCGNIGLDVGLPGRPYANGTYCICSERRSISRDGFFPSAFLFRPIDPLHEALDAIEENHTVEPEPAFA